jgi:hypothetical protein
LESRTIAFSFRIEELDGKIKDMKYGKAWRMVKDASMMQLGCEKIYGLADSSIQRFIFQLHDFLNSHGKTCA